jgi:hypothetical protein
MTKGPAGSLIAPARPCTTRLVVVEPASVRPAPAVARRLCEASGVEACPCASAALATARRRDEFWSVFDARHTVLRRDLVVLAGEVSRLRRLSMPVPVPA